MLTTSLLDIFYLFIFHSCVLGFLFGGWEKNCLISGAPPVNGHFREGAPDNNQPFSPTEARPPDTSLPYALCDKMNIHLYVVDCCLLTVKALPNADAKLQQGLLVCVRGPLRLASSESPHGVCCGCRGQHQSWSNQWKNAQKRTYVEVRLFYNRLYLYDCLIRFGRD